MITEHDLKAAIAECQGKRNPDANTCIKLAAFLIIKREMYGVQQQDGYSYAPPPADPEEILYDGESEFARTISRKTQGEVWPVIDDLMGILTVIHPRLYDAVMAKLF